MARVKINITTPRIAAGIALKLSRAIDKPLIRKMVDAHRETTLEEFRAGARFLPSGGTARWAPRKDFGSLNKRPPGPAVLNGGRLYNAVAGGAGGFSRINKRSARWGVSGSIVPYWRWHRGTSGNADSSRPTEQRVTPRQRAFLLAHGVHLKTGAKIVNPGRPWGGDSKRLRIKLRAIIKAHIKVAVR
jgi:hypothetical protein